MEPTRKAPARWTRLNIALHWTVLGLLILQFIDHEWMVELFDRSRESAASSALTLFMGYGHIVVGWAIFAAVAIRLWDRYAHGRPPAPDIEFAWAAVVAKVVHFSLYATLLSMPLAGALAWFTGNDTIATIHGWAWTVLLVLVGLHVAGALANHFWLRNDVLRRMMLGQGRDQGRTVDARE